MMRLSTFGSQRHARVPAALRGLVLLVGCLGLLSGQTIYGSTLLPLRDLGNTTFDPNTGLEWLDLRFTAGQSYQSVLDGWNGFTTTQGFRFATRDEVTRLFLDAGATTIGFPEGSPSWDNLQAAAQTLALLGTTLDQGELRRSWMYYDRGTEPTLPTAVHVPSAVFGTGVIRGGYQPEGFFLVPGCFPGLDYGSPEMASGLVRVVPEPSATLLLLGFLGLHRLTVARFTPTAKAPLELPPGQSGTSRR